MKDYICCLLFLTSCISLCQENTVAQDTITILEEVVIYHPLKNKESLGITPSTIIREKAFQNFSPIDVASAINQISGVYLLSGALNTNRITIRGVGARTPFGTNKLRLYYNDIPVTNGTGFSTLEAFDLENLNSIEVIKGPKGTAYGSNLGGAILLNSKEQQDHTTQFVNHLTIGSYHLVKNNLSFQHTSDSLSINLHYNFLNTDSYRDNNKIDRNGLLLTTAVKLNKKNKLTFLGNFIDFTAQIPSSLDKSNFETDPTKAAFTWKAAQGFEGNKYALLAISHAYQFNSNTYNTSSIFYSYLDHYEPRPFNILDEFTNAFGFRNRLSGQLKMGSLITRYNLGFEFYKDEYNWNTYTNLYASNNGNGSLQGDKISDNKEFRRQFFAFTNLNFPLSQRLTMQLGLNFNKTHYDFKDLFNTGSTNKNAKRSFAAVLLPSLDVEYRFHNNNRFFANISRGFSNPSLEETLTPEGVINPDIEQEKGMNYEFGVELLLLQSQLWLNFTAYRMNINDLLVAQRIGEDEFIGKNAGSTRHQGIDLDMNYGIPLSESLKISPFLSYTYSDHSFIEFIDGANDFSGNPLTGVPKHRLNAGLRLAHTSSFYWNNTWQYVSKIPLTDSNILSSDSYSIFNTQLGYRLELSDQFGMGFELGVNNIFNTLYAQSVLINAVGFGGNEPRYFYPGNDRNFYTGIRLFYQL